MQNIAESLSVLVATGTLDKAGKKRVSQILLQKARIQLRDACTNMEDALRTDTGLKKKYKSRQKDICRQAMRP